MRFVPLLALIAFASPALAQNTATPAPEKKICRRAPATGSIMGGKPECHTKAEWASISERSQNDRDARERQTRGRNGGLGISRDN